MDLLLLEYFSGIVSHPRDLQVLFLSCPTDLFIMGLICDLIVSCDISLMGQEAFMVSGHWRC